MTSRRMTFDETGTARFISFNCFRGMTNFNADLAISIFIKHLKLIRERYPVRIYGYVIMPDHVHLVLHPTGEMKMSYLIRELKSRSAREYFEVSKVKPPGSRGVFWQEGYHDHNCRTVEEVIEKIKYCHKNPQVRGLVSHLSQWKWSSFNWYQGLRDVPLDMDEIDIMFD